MRIIGLCGAAGSGKSTIAKRLTSKWGFVEIALADPLKRFCQEVYDFSTDQLWGPSESRNAPDLRYLSDPQIPGSYLTPRHALQQLGTEWGRACYPDTWIDYALRQIRRLDSSKRQSYAPWQGCYPVVKSKPYQGVVISDLRFENEIRKLHSVGGSIWHITRPQPLQRSYMLHASERTSELDPDFFDVRIHNDFATLEDLSEAVDYWNAWSDQ